MTVYFVRMLERSAKQEEEKEKKKYQLKHQRVAPHRTEPMTIKSEQNNLVLEKVHQQTLNSGLCKVWRLYGQHI